MTPVTAFTCACPATSAPTSAPASIPSVWRSTTMTSSTFTLSDRPGERPRAQVIIHRRGRRHPPTRRNPPRGLHLPPCLCQTFGLGRTRLHRCRRHNNIPQARGMGSSAEAIVAGIAAAAAFAQDRRPQPCRPSSSWPPPIEGHPDNVAPAVYGGLTVSWDYRDRGRRRLRADSWR